MLLNESDLEKKKKIPRKTNIVQQRKRQNLRHEKKIIEEMDDAIIIEPLLSFKMSIL